MNRKRSLFFFGVLAALAVVAIPVAFASPASQAFHAPRIKVKQGTSTNWSGYAVETNLNSPASNAVSDVRGQWVVPTLSCTSSSTWSSIWVGIDGYSSGTVEQTGTEQDCSGGQAKYSAWYEMYPKFPVTLNLTISPGDTISAEVRWVSNNSFTLTLSDLTTGKSFTTTQKTKAKRQSAEWVVEAPWSGGVLPLANFGTTGFSNASATLTSGGTTTTGTISNGAWQNDSITMVNSSGATKAQPSGLSPDGSSFSVTWYASN